MAKRGVLGFFSGIGILMGAAPGFCSDVTLASLSGSSAAVSALPSELPPDAPVTTEAIHDLEHPSADRLRISLGYAFLNGDKFMDSHGYELGFNYFLAEEWAIGLTGTLFSNSVTDEAYQVGNMGAHPLMLNPLFLARLSAVYQPIYGKLLIGNHIQHFRLGFRTGLSFGMEEWVRSYGSGDSSSYYKSSSSFDFQGFHAGVLLNFPVSKTLFLGFSTDFLLKPGSQDAYSDYYSNTTGTRRSWLYGLQLGVEL